MKTITVNVDEDFLNQVNKMVYFMKATGNLHPDIDEFQAFAGCIILGISRNLPEITISKEGRIIL
jgi:hypothetical protein